MTPSSGDIRPPRKPLWKLWKWGNRGYGDDGMRPPERANKLVAHKITVKQLDSHDWGNDYRFECETCGKVGTKCQQPELANMEALEHAREAWMAQPGSGGEREQ